MLKILILMSYTCQCPAFASRYFQLTIYRFFPFLGKVYESSNRGRVWFRWLASLIDITVHFSPLLQHKHGALSLLPWVATLTHTQTVACSPPTCLSQFDEGVRVAWWCLAGCLPRLAAPSHCPPSLMFSIAPHYLLASTPSLMNSLQFLTSGS